jgi:Tfp pilus assembly protein PilN
VIEFILAAIAAVVVGIVTLMFRVISLDKKAHKTEIESAQRHAEAQAHTINQIKRTHEAVKAVHEKAREVEIENNANADTRPTGSFGDRRVLDDKNR